MTATDVKQPVHGMAWLAFGLSVLAVILAFYGSLYAEKHIHDSPLRAARGSAGLPAQPSSWYDRALAKCETTIFGERIDSKMFTLTQNSKIANYSVQLVAFVLPFFMGLAGALVGGWGMSLIERSRGRNVGNFQCVFSILVGMFAAVIAGCMLLSFYVWPALPSLYTT